MSAARQIVRNILSNSAGFVVTMAVALMLSPFVVRKLGDEMYGVWSLTIALTGSYGLLDLGIRSAVGHYLTLYHAKGDREGVARTMNTALSLMFVAMSLAALITVVLAVVFPTWKPEAYATEPRAVAAILIMGFSLALSFPMALFSAVLYASQRLDLQNMVGISQRLLNAAATVVMLQAGMGILGIAIAVAGCTVAAGFANARIARRLMPDLQIRLWSFSRRSFNELKGYGFYNFIVNASDNILVYSDYLVIGFAIPAMSAVTYYTIGANLIPHYMSVVLAVTWAITPYATAQYAAGDMASLRRLILGGTRGTMALAALLGGGLLLLGHDFLGQWMGWSYVSGRQYPSSAIILAILASATLLRASQSMVRQVLFAVQEVRFLGMLALAEAGTNLLISLVLVRKYGIVGVALGTLIPIALTQGIVQPLFACRRLDIDLGRFFGAVLRGLLPALLAMDLAYLLGARHLAVDSWMDFVVKASAVGVPGLIAVLCFSLGPQERAQVARKLGIGRARGRAG